MKPIAIYTLTSPLHDEKSVSLATQEFLGSLDIDYDFQGSDYTTYGQHTLDLIYVRTGGTESVMKPLLPSLLKQSSQPILLLTSGKSNSLAASMEILSYLKQNHIQGEILHGSPSYIRDEITIRCQIADVRKQLKDCRLGVIGTPSDWLISSSVDRDAIKQRFGIELVDVPLDEVKAEYERTPDESDEALSAKAPNEAIRTAIPGALRIYRAIKNVIERHQLQGFTIRCFDLLSSIHNTGCIALAKLNSEGYIAGCEGDIPAMLSMRIAQALTGLSGFQANPAWIDPEKGEMMFAHCTIPFNMLERYELDTHFESGIGVGVRGYMKEGDVTIFKMSGDLSRCFIAEGTLLRSEGNEGLCRTQQVIRLDEPKQAEYFLKAPIGNHHIILPGHWKTILEQIIPQ